MKTLWGKILFLIIALDIVLLVVGGRYYVAKNSSNSAPFIESTLETEVARPNNNQLIVRSAIDKLVEDEMTTLPEKCLSAIGLREDASFLYFQIIKINGPLCGADAEGPTIALVRADKNTGQLYIDTSGIKKEESLLNRWPLTEKPEGILERNFFGTGGFEQSDFIESNNEYEFPEFPGNGHWSLLKGGLITEDGVQKYQALFAFQVPENERSHFATTLIGGGSLTSKDGYWKAESIRKLITSVGYGGEIPEVKIIKIGPQKLGYLFSYGTSITGGYSSSRADIIAFIGGTPRVVMRWLTSDEGSTSYDREERYSYTTKETFIPGNNSEFYDIKLVTTGTTVDRANPKGPYMSINETVVYKFIDDMYKK